MMKFKYRAVAFVLLFTLFYILLSHYFNINVRLKSFFPLENKVNLISRKKVNLNTNYLHYNIKYQYNTKSMQDNNILNSLKIKIVLAVVACGDRLHETLMMIKSAILFGIKNDLKIVVIADHELIQSFKEKLNEWKELMNNTFSFELHPIAFPIAEENEWRKLFKPCASQRLFLPNVLPHIDSVLYVDTDTLFLAPLDDIWSYFKAMNSSQMAALAPEHEDPNTGWYNRFARHPFYGKLGVNSGVMLMNLTRMRQFKWEKYLSPIYKEFKLKITWGDQDIINIIFHYHPEKLLQYSCRYNYRPDHCMYMSVCHDAVDRGVAVVHGSRGAFHGNKHPVFQSIYRTMEEFQLGSDVYENFLLPLESYLDQTTDTNCGKVRKIFTKNIQHLIEQKETYR
uniref:UDP-D-xylose:beta-D-glucoside alpha-1,3-D-xylosyltransferase n=2 Tax=Clastoptera arizonana TaxID=38151 RepID=A0A1B6CX52_9HEMI